MRISRRKPKPQQVIQHKYKMNLFIKSPELRVIDENGQNLGVMETSKAIGIAQERGLDVVEVSPKAQPPVAKIVDYSKMKYQEEKERRKEKAKQKKVEVKGIRLSLRISEHDKEVRMKQALKFLEDGDKVKIEIILRGRERRHTDMAKDNINTFIESVNQSRPVKTEQNVTVQGGKLSALISNA